MCNFLYSSPTQAGAPPIKLQNIGIAVAFLKYNEELRNDARPRAERNDGVPALLIMPGVQSEA